MSSIDKLSGLPDEVICHILSFLSTKTSASTNCLAKRWRFLWTHVPNLDYRGYKFEDGTQDSDIIHRIIVLNQAKTMNTFKLSDVNCTGFQLATWIIHAINRGVRNLYLDFRQGIYITALFTLPGCLLTCKTLVDVKLHSCRGIASSGKVFLPSLKKLHLSCIKYEDDESLPHLLSGCPVLEDLIIDNSDVEKVNDDWGCVCVSSPTIKFLNVELSSGCPILKINAPSLGYLKVNICYLRDITILRKMTSLIEADFSLMDDCDDDEEDREDEEEREEAIDDYNKFAVQFLNCICNLKCLKMSYKLVKIINLVGLDAVVKFDHLTKLKFDLIFEWHELVKFLEVAKNLEVLTFTLGVHFTYREPKLVPTCMFSRLKTVRIKRLYGLNEHNFETIRYVLKNARVLERMEVHSYCIPDEDRLEMSRRISLLERGSKRCQLVFC